MKSRIVTGVFVVLAIVLCFVSLSHAQVGYSGGQQAPTQPTYSVPDHPQHASQGDLRPEQSLLGSNGVTTAHGERPLSDFPDDKRETPLGDVARAYRKEHAAAEKATIIFERQ